MVLLQDHPRLLRNGSYVHVRRARGQSSLLGLRGLFGGRWRLASLGFLSVTNGTEDSSFGVRRSNQWRRTPRVTSPTPRLS